MYFYFYVSAVVFTHTFVFIIVDSCPCNDVIDICSFKLVCGYTYSVAAFGRMADSAVSQSERSTNKPKYISVVVCYN